MANRRGILQNIAEHIEEDMKKASVLFYSSDEFLMYVCQKSRPKVRMESVSVLVKPNARWQNVRNFGVLNNNGRFGSHKILSKINGRRCSNIWLDDFIK